MKNSWFRRMFALVLCLCLFPFAAWAETAENSGTAPQESPKPEEVQENGENRADEEDEWDEEWEEDWDEEGDWDEDDEDSEAPAQEPKTGTRSAFTLGMQLHTENFPQRNSTLEAWEVFLKKISLRGTIDTMDFLQPYSRVYFNGGVYVNDDLRVPFVYDGYHSYRYLVSPAIRNDSLHFQMHNFFEFMLKPYYYMDLPTQYIAFLMYPEASYYIGDSYYTPTAETLAGEGSRNIPYERLYELAETLDLLVLDDPHYLRAETYFLALLIKLNAVDMVLEKLGDLEALLEFLDPEQEGMNIKVTGNQESYVLGETTVFEKKKVGEAVYWTVTLPDPDGYLISLDYEWIPSARGAMLKGDLNISQDGRESIHILVEGSGLPCEGDTEGRGRLSFTVGGDSFEKETTQTFAFQWDIDDGELPWHLNLQLDWLHPETKKPALSATYAADMKQIKETVFKEGTYPQDDFFNLNDSSLEDYKQRYAPSLALAFLPLILEMPAGVINSIYTFADQTGILLSLGL